MSNGLMYPDLPLVLSSAVDVRTVCEAAGLAKSEGSAWASAEAGVIVVHLRTLRCVDLYDYVTRARHASFNVGLANACPSTVLFAAIQAARADGCSSAPPKPHQKPVADLSRDDRTDRITTAIENAADCADITVTVQEADGTEAPLRRLARCLDGAGLIDHEGI